MDNLSVIILGHTQQQPLIRPSSELSYRSEPHDHILSAVMTGVREYWCTWAGSGVPGVVQTGGYMEGCIPGTQPRSIIQAYLMNI